MQPHVREPMARRWSIHDVLFLHAVQRWQLDDFRATLLVDDATPRLVPGMALGEA
jgi:hypothetical protein